MTSPEFAEFQRLTRKGNLIAVLRSAPADLETPVSAFLKLADKLPHTFLLESAEQAEQVGRYSIIGLEPAGIVTETEKGTQLQTGAKKTQWKKRPSVSVLEELLHGQKLANADALPGFAGGWVGYLSYECVSDFESVKLSRKKGPVFPRSIFFLVKDYVVFDHLKKNLTVVSIVDTGKKANLKKVYNAACARIDRVLLSLNRPLAHPKPNERVNIKNLKSNMTKAFFKAQVNRIKEYIRAGDCIQVVFSQRFGLKAVKQDFQIYRAIRSLNPSPYMFYFRSKNIRLVGSSPELLVNKRGRFCEVRPIAGTRPRGKTPADDLALEDHLRRSRKEIAEHLMLVDLGRNDLGRVCEFNSVKVKDFAHVERYSHVMHLVSDVSGILKKGKTAFDLLRVTFPAGTVSGAPKIRAMQIIDELEKETRGPYAGCLGFFGFDHNMEMCITIRTLASDGKKCYIQAGAGIVKDSNPDREFQESVNKAKAMVQALKSQERY